MTPTRGQMLFTLSLTDMFKVPGRVIGVAQLLVQTVGRAPRFLAQGGLQLTGVVIRVVDIVACGEDLLGALAGLKVKIQARIAWEVWAAYVEIQTRGSRGSARQYARRLCSRRPRCHPRPARLLAGDL
jgi:hypothetical protein